MNVDKLKYTVLELLYQMISTPSFSGNEEKTAQLIGNTLKLYNIPIKRFKNNIISVNKYFNESKPTILLNSHHDTVKPNKGYTRDPFKPEISDGKLYGLGSNDAGGPLVSLLSSFIFFYNKKNLNYNLLFAATAEEESSGPNGLNSILQEFPPIDFAVVGEPTGMQMAIAEKGLLVIDAYAPGKAGHAAHENTENAIYTAIEDIEYIKNYHFNKVSDFLGPVKMTVTQINAGEQHNVVPASCHFVIDIRVNENYTNHEIFDHLNQNTKSQLKARSFNLKPSFISESHPFVMAGKKWGRKTYGSPTLSDQSVLSCPSLKIGPGDSKRSHNADEYIGLDELEEGINLLRNIFNEILIK